jgi:hypothetical protein
MQQSFFWHGRDDANGGSGMVAWKDVCRPVELGHSGIKNLRFMEWALQDRWPWYQRPDQAQDQVPNYSESLCCWAGTCSYEGEHRWRRVIPLLDGPLAWWPGHSWPGTHSVCCGRQACNVHHWLELNLVKFSHIVDIIDAQTSAKHWRQVHLVTIGVWGVLKQISLQGSLLRQHWITFLAGNLGWLGATQV